MCTHICIYICIYVYTCIYILIYIDLNVHANTPANAACPCRFGFHIFWQFSLYKYLYTHTYFKKYPYICNIHNKGVTGQRHFFGSFNRLAGAGKRDSFVSVKICVVLRHKKILQHALSHCICVYLYMCFTLQLRYIRG